MAPTPPKSTTTTPSTKKKSGSRKRQAPEETSDMTDPAATASGIKRRRSAAGRSLIRWDFEKDQLLLLALEYECAKLGQPLPWDEAVKHVKDGATGQAVIQHLAKVRKYRIESGQLVPPEPLKRRLPKPKHLGGRPSKVSFDDVTDDDEDNYSNPFKGSKSRMVFAPISDPKTPRNKIPLSHSRTPGPSILRRRTEPFKEEPFAPQEEVYNNDPDAAQNSGDEWKPNEQVVPFAPTKKRRGRPATAPTTPVAVGLPVHRHKVSKVEQEEPEIGDHGRSQDTGTPEFRSIVPTFNATLDRFNRRTRRARKQLHKNRLAMRDLSPENGIVKEQTLEDPFTDHQHADANPAEQPEHAERSEQVELASQATVGYSVPWVPPLSPPGSPTPTYNSTYQPMMNVPESIAGPRDANIGPLFRLDPALAGLSAPADRLEIENYNVSRGWTNPMFRPNIGNHDESTPRLWSNPRFDRPVPVGTNTGGSQMVPHDARYFDYTTGNGYIGYTDHQSLVTGSMGAYNNPQDLVDPPLVGYCDAQGVPFGSVGDYNDQQGLANTSLVRYCDSQGLPYGPMGDYNDQQRLAYETTEGHDDFIDFSGGQSQQFDMGLADMNFAGIEHNETRTEGVDGSHEVNQTIAPMLLMRYDPAVNTNQGMGMRDNNDPQYDPPMNDNQDMGMGMGYNDPQYNPPYGDMLICTGSGGTFQNTQN